MPGPFAPAPEKEIGGVGFSLSVFGSLAGFEVRFTAADDEALFDCCSSRRKFAAVFEEGTVLPAPALFVDFVES